MTSGDAVTNA